MDGVLAILGLEWAEVRRWLKEWGQLTAAICAALLAGTLALLGGYLARRVEDRRARRAGLLEEPLPAAMSRLEHGAHYSHHDVFDPLKALRRNAAATSAWDMRQVQNVIDKADHAYHLPRGEPNDYGDQAITVAQTEAWAGVARLAERYETALMARLVGSTRDRLGWTKVAKGRG